MTSSQFGSDSFSAHVKSRLQRSKVGGNEEATLAMQLKEREWWRRQAASGGDEPILLHLTGLAWCEGLEMTLGSCFLDKRIVLTCQDRECKNVFGGISNPFWPS